MSAPKLIDRARERASAWREDGRGYDAKRMEEIANAANELYNALDTIREQAAPDSLRTAEDATYELYLIHQKALAALAKARGEQ